MAGRGFHGPAPVSSRKSRIDNRWRRVLMDVKIDDGLKALLDSGKDKGYLTYSQVNDYLPDDAVNPEKLDQLLMLLEEQGIDLIDEADIDEREAKDGKAEEAADVDAELRELDLS